MVRAVDLGNEPMLFAKMQQCFLETAVNID